MNRRKKDAIDKISIDELKNLLESSEAMKITLHYVSDTLPLEVKWINTKTGKEIIVVDANDMEEV